MNGSTETENQKIKPQLDNILNELRRQALSTPENESGDPLFGSDNPKTFNQMIAEQRAREHKIDNDNREKDQKLKEKTLKILFAFLGVETVIIFLLAFVQGFELWGFCLDDWSFRLVILATLGQITAMLVIAVQHLFPKKETA